MLQPGVSVTRNLSVQPRGPYGAWHGASLMTVALEGAAVFACPLLPLSPAPASALGKTFGTTKKVQPWTDGTAIRPLHYPS